MGVIIYLPSTMDIPVPQIYKDVPILNQPVLGGGFKYVLCSPLVGEDSHFDLTRPKGPQKVAEGKSP